MFAYASVRDERIQSSTASLGGNRNRNKNVTSLAARQRKPRPEELRPTDNNAPEAQKGL